MIIDRFEGEFAVVETDDGMLDIPVSLIPEDAEEGDVIVSENGRYIVDKEETESRRKKLSERFLRLLEEDED